MNIYKKLLFPILFLVVLQVSAQQREQRGPVYVDSARAVPAAALSKKKLIPPSTEFKLVNPRNRGINQVVPGKGLPRTLDPTRQAELGKIPVKAPELSFVAAITRSTPSDPTGAAGPNHYVNAWNSAFSIFDKSGNRIMEPASLASLGGEFTNETLGDPLVIYDQYADRFLIMQFSDTPESFLIAVSRGPNPMTDGWYTYRFTTNGALPDYPKLSVWHDGYYITTNKNSRTASTSQVLYVLERSKMLEGETALVVGFPLPGIKTNGFYSPSGFNAAGDNLPQGEAHIIFMQDDAWEGVSEDHLKIWGVNMNWNSPAASTVREYQELGASEGVNPFNATFDGGAFSNLSQPGTSAPDIDVLQATVMHMTMFRKFSTHNSVVLNFVVDLDPTAAEHAGVRWYELRQDSAGGPWRVHQEGTYAPDSSDRFGGSIGIDRNGNIGLGFTILDDSPVNPIYPSIRYTGRYANDPLGIMTVIEKTIIEGPSPDPSSRYGDYSHLTVDPVDDLTFWHNAEYFVGIDRLNRVGVFKLAPDFANDVGIIAVVSPNDATLSNSEEVTVTIRNFGSTAQSNFSVSYSVNGGEIITEMFTGTVAATSSVDYTFSIPANLGIIGETYEIIASTNLPTDQQIENNTFTTDVTNLYPIDVGITSIDSPSTGLTLSSAEEVTVTIENFGGEPQSNIPVFYMLENNVRVEEIYPGTIPVGEEAVYVFSQTANLEAYGRFRITAETDLEGDAIPTNDGSTKSVANLNCIPFGSDCTTFGDGIYSFQLGDILNERIPCIDGYADYIGYSTNLDRSQRTYIVRVKTLFDSEEGDEKFSLWIDFNDNGVFDDVERLITSQVIPTANEWHSFEITLPANAPLGEHLMRVRAGDTSFEGDLDDPCSVMEYGSTHDYSVRIVDSSLNIDDFLLNEANFEISNQGNGIYRVFLETDFAEPLRITIYDILGQKLLENQVETNGFGYLYTFDMSYAATGVYLLRIGTREVGRVKRFIVE